MRTKVSGPESLELAQVMKKKERITIGYFFRLSNYKTFVPNFRQSLSLLIKLMCGVPDLEKYDYLPLLSLATIESTVITSHLGYVVCHRFGTLYK